MKQNTEEKPASTAMAFYHEDGLVAAWQFASKFAEKGGRIATMPDIVAARLATKPGDAPWETYYTTSTSEFFGRTKRGNLIIIVAHGVGPMSNLDGALKAYSWEYKSNRRKRGGRITRKQFMKLESGNYGDVEIIDFKKYYFNSPYKYPFIQMLRSSEAMNDPLLKARLGPKAEQYIAAHTKYAQEWDTGVADPYILSCGDPNNLPYAISGNTYEECGYAFAHLISTSRLANVHHEGNVSLCLDLHCHEWGDGVRLVGVRSSLTEKAITNIRPGPDAHWLIQKHWGELMIPVPSPEIDTVGFRALMKVDEDFAFTQYRKYGARMDTWEPEYCVLSSKPIGKPVPFRTEIGGYYGFFKYDVQEVKLIAPPEANAYFFVSDPEIEYKDGNPSFHTCLVQFYHVKANMTMRVMRHKELIHNYEKMIALVDEKIYI